MHNDSVPKLFQSLKNFLNLFYFFDSALMLIINVPLSDLDLKFQYLYIVGR